MCSHCLPIVFRLADLALNLKLSVLLGCKAGFIVYGYWCPTLWISLVMVFASGFPFICFLLCPNGFRVSPCLPSLVSLSTCLSSLVCLHLLPALANGLSVLGGAVSLITCLPSCVCILASGAWLFGCLLVAFTWLP